MTIRVIVVEDDLDIASEVIFHLTRHQMQVAHAADGVALDALLTRQPCDVIVLDLGLKGEDGLSIAARLSHREDLRVVMLTARARSHDRILGFQAGADVYLAKPVDMRELVSVITRVTRRLPAKRPPLVLDGPTSALQAEGSPPIELTAKEFQFLRLLALSRTLSLSRVTLEDALWSAEEETVARRMEVMISRLRKKLAAAGLEDLIRTEWGVGYRLSKAVFVQ